MRSIYFTKHTKAYELINVQWCPEQYKDYIGKEKKN
jgi:hypothetical protein